LLCAHPHPVDELVIVPAVARFVTGEAPEFTHAPPDAVATMCVCAGISVVSRVWVFEPPVSPSASNSVSLELNPTGTFPLRFGTLNVVEPSPTQ